LNEPGELVGILRIVLQGLAGAGGVALVAGLAVYLVLRARLRRSEGGSISYRTLPTRSSTPAPRVEPGSAESFAVTAGTITCTAGPLRGQEFALGQGVSIGRDAARATIVVDDRQVSGQHVWVGPLDGRWRSATATCSPWAARAR
jgi:hypothetical protein